MSTRIQWLETFALAIFSDIYNKCIENCAIYYKAGENLFVDEMLFRSTDKYKFTQYMPNKTDNFCIKIRVIIDVD